ncbi:MAG: hypothetical protein L3J12_01855 [Spirochaetales bacterium]|nr:hypothetical protein [Spirochaetales bacterium]
MFCCYESGPTGYGLEREINRSKIGKYQRMIDELKKNNPEVIIIMHSDGAVVPLIDDTNIIVYAHDKKYPCKQEKAQELIFNGMRENSAVISAQVLSEFWVTVTQKFKEPLSFEITENQIELFQLMEIGTHTLCKPANNYGICFIVKNEKWFIIKERDQYPLIRYRESI